MKYVALLSVTTNTKAMNYGLVTLNLVSWSTFSLVMWTLYDYVIHEVIIQGGVHRAANNPLFIYNIIVNSSKPNSQDICHCFDHLWWYDMMYSSYFYDDTTKPS